METLVEKSKAHCLALLNSGRYTDLPFHNRQHTLDVYRYARLIAAYEDLTREETEPLLIAALFHDTGNAQSFDGHEEIGAVNAISFLKEMGYSDRKMELVYNCIISTCIPQRPRNIYERILCDADLYHLGAMHFISLNEKLRTEWELYQNRYYSDSEWYTMNHDFLLEHNFQTNYGQSVLEPVKQQNQKLFETLLANMQLI